MNDNTVYLTGDKGFEPEFVFAVQGDAFVYDAAGSDAKALQQIRANICF